jgi:hypothetical protein
MLLGLHDFELVVVPIQRSDGFFKAFDDIVLILHFFLEILGVQLFFLQSCNDIAEFLYLGRLFSKCLFELL